MGQCWAGLMVGQCWGRVDGGTTRWGRVDGGTMLGQG